jgi:hypothetical protein
VSVVLPKVVSEIFCTPAKAKSFVLTISISSVIYNIPHFFEIYALDCFDHDGAFSLQVFFEILQFSHYWNICPTLLEYLSPISDLSDQLSAKYTLLHGNL